MLLIEKVIKLLDDFHYKAFRDHLKNRSKRSYYPLVLVDVIDRDIEVKQNVENLCKDVYSENDKKTRRKFIQLAHHTFKMTSFLARNYPDYLLPNINFIQQLINDKQVDRAMKLADILLEVCRKVEDFSTELKLLKIQSQLNFLFESAFYSIKLQERITVLLGYERDFNEVSLYYLRNLGQKTKMEKKKVNLHAQFFKNHFSHESTILRLMCTYYYCFNFYALRDDRFFSTEIYDLLIELENDLLKFDYLVTTFLTDFLNIVRFLKINFQIHEFKEDFDIQIAENLIDNKDVPLFTKSIVNYAEIYSLAIQSSFHLNYSMKGFRADRNNLIDSETREKINHLQKYCEEILKNELFEERFTLRYINLTVIYAGFLLCGEEKEIRKSIELLENIMITYQQVSFHFLLDSIYSLIIIGHFCLKEYTQVEETYKRYKKATNKKAVNAENKNTIHGFYYAAKWIETSRPQFAQKFSTLIQESQKPDLKRNQKILVEIAQYFNIPINFIIQ